MGRWSVDLIKPILTTQCFDCQQTVKSLKKSYSASTFLENKLISLNQSGFKLCYYSCNSWWRTCRKRYLSRYIHSFWQSITKSFCLKVDTNWYKWWSTKHTILLLKRWQKTIVLNRKASSWGKVLAAVSQDSIPCRMLFLVYIHDLCEGLLLVQSYLLMMVLYSMSHPIWMLLQIY